MVVARWSLAPRTLLPISYGICLIDYFGHWRAKPVLSQERTGWLWKGTPMREMHELMRSSCAICGEERSAESTWFLVAENRWEDKLTVLQWNEELADWEGVHRACSPEHVAELVVHWMTTGSLDYPFARAALGAATLRRMRTNWPQKSDLHATHAEQVGELLVHRESIERVLNESPESLKPVLDALVSALHKEIAPTRRPVRRQEIGATNAVPRAV